MDARRDGRLGRLLAPLAGLLALAWFLIRVIPKPSRAAYPCQRAAFPLASAFVLWVVSLFATGWFWRRGRALLRTRRGAAAVCLLLAAASAGTAWLAQPTRPALAAPRAANDPIGTARGLNPGRVVWVHDPGATDWAGPGDGMWWSDAHTDPAAVLDMLDAAVTWLAGVPDPAGAWDALFRHHNRERGRGDVGYAPGEKIMIKVNLVGCHYLPGWGGVDPETYDLTSYLDYMNTSPQAMAALLRRLVETVGAAQADLTIGDPLSLFPEDYHAMLAGDFPDVRYLDHAGGVPGRERVAAADSEVELHWSVHPSGYDTDHVLASYAEATYLINLANFKSHATAGVTLCAKNHYGSLIRYPVEPGFFGLHADLPANAPEPGRYRPVVDLMGHAHLGGKTVLYLIDGLYAGCHPYDLAPIRWDAAPFHGDWTSSLFASQDPVAIESVGLDLMQLEGDPRRYPQMAGADDYLHEAALAHDPPSGTFYDPDHAGDVARLPSLGVHEHWDDPATRRYSRDLGTGEGIELVRLSTETGAGTPAPVLRARCAPNPFNPRTTIRFELPASGPAEVAVYDLRGARVSVLLDRPLPAGAHEVAWDAGAHPSGVYVFRVRAAGATTTGRMTLAK